MILPTFMDLQDWADSAVQDLSRYGIVGRLDDPDSWQQWATQVCGLPKVRTLNPPNPYEFAEWRMWAERFVSLPL